jgi:L-aspartate oxidase
MGGVWTNAHGRSSLEGLWAIGEVAATGVHGANRLASNSLLEAVVFAARAASDIRTTDLSNVSASEPAPPATVGWIDKDLGVIEELRDLMSANVGVTRDAAGLSGALGQLRRLRARAGDIEILNMLTTSTLIAAAAFARRESRGAHFRSDYPVADPSQAQRSQMTLDMALRIADEAHS